MRQHCPPQFQRHQYALKPALDQGAGFLHPESGSPAMELTPEERSQRARIASHARWGRTENRTAATAPARRGLEEKFLREAGGDPLRAESLRREHFARLAYKSARARRRRGATNRTDSTGPGAR